MNIHMAPPSVAWIDGAMGSKGQVRHSWTGSIVAEIEDGSKGIATCCFWRIFERMGARIIELACGEGGRESRYRGLGREARYRGWGVSPKSVGLYRGKQRNIIGHKHQRIGKVWWISPFLVSEAFPNIVSACPKRIQVWPKQAISEVFLVGFQT